MADSFFTYSVLILFYGLSRGIINDKMKQMSYIKKEIIKEVIDDLNGLVFKNSEPYSEEAKVFFLNRYYEILKLLPEIKKKDIGLEIGLAGGVLAFVVKRLLDLNNLYSLEHPVTFLQYKKSFLDKLIRNKIILEPVDLRKDKMPWKDEFFDFIIFSEVIEHLVPADIPNLMIEINRILKKDGYLIVTTPNISSLLKRINLLLGKNPIEFDLRLHEEATYGHIREYTMEELIEITKIGNFKIKDKKYFMIDSKRNIFTRLEDVSSRIFPSLANNLAIIAKK